VFDFSCMYVQWQTHVRFKIEVIALQGAKEK